MWAGMICVTISAAHIMDTSNANKRIWFREEKSYCNVFSGTFELLLGSQSATQPLHSKKDDLSLPNSLYIKYDLSLYGL